MSNIDGKALRPNERALISQQDQLRLTKASANSGELRRSEKVVPEATKTSGTFSAAVLTPARCSKIRSEVNERLGRRGKGLSEPDSDTERHPRLIFFIGKRVGD